MDAQPTPARERNRGFLSRRQLRGTAVLLMVLLVVVSLAVVTIIMLSQMSYQARTQAITRLEAIAELKRAQIDQWLDTVEMGVDLFLSDLRRQAGLSAYVADPSSGTEAIHVRVLQDAAEAVPGIIEFFVYDREGRIQISSDTSQIGVSVADQPFFATSVSRPYLQPPYYDAARGAVTIILTEPLRQGDFTVGALAARLDMAFLADVMGATTGLGESGETYLVSAADHYLVTPSRFDGYPANRAYHSAGIDRALAREDGVDTYANYQEPPATVIGVYRWLPKLQAAMLAEIAEVEALAAAQESLFSSVAVAALAALISAGVSVFAVSYLTRPLNQLAQVATQVAQGNLHLRARVGQQNEVGQVAAAFNSMADQFTNLIDTLEHRVTARTHDIATIAEIGRVATQIHDVDVLLPRMVNLIQQAFGFYHVQIFMLDDSGRYAVLKASTGEAGEELLRRRHSLPVGSQSVIGQVTLTGDPVIALDTEGADVIHRPNALLPDTRSEMALALRIGNRIVGALDVQSVEPNAFDQDHVSVFQGMADQIAVAINNATLLGESEARLRQIEQLNRQLVGETWRRHMQNYANGTLAYTADPGGMQPAGEATPTQTRALTSGEPVIQRRDEGVHVALPLRYGGAVIGVLEFMVDHAAYNDDKLTLAQMLADRLGVSVESARLFDQSRRQTLREQTISTVSMSMQGHETLEDVLRTATAELSKALGARRAAVRLGVEQGMKHG